MGSKGLSFARSYAAIPLIVVTSALIYSNVLHAPFVFDDDFFIVDNPTIRELGNFFDLSGTRYVAALSFALNYRFGGLDTFGYHAVNIAIHSINGLLVWWLVILTCGTPCIKKTFSDDRTKQLFALAAAMIFVTHPVQTQAVTYVSQRFASLATLFYLLSLAMFIKWRLSSGAGGRSVFYIFSLFSAVLAMKTKEISFTLPFIIVLYEFTFFGTPFNERGRSARLPYLAPFLLTLLIVPMDIIGSWLGGPGEGPGHITEATRRALAGQLDTVSRYDYTITQFRVIVTYLRILILPVNQNADYDYPLFHSIFEPEVFLSFLFLLSLFGFAVYLFLRSRITHHAHGLLTSFGILWFFIALSVESFMGTLWDPLVEYRMYLPSAGAAVAFSAGVFYLFERTKLKNLAAAACVLLLLTAVPLGAAAYKRNLVWADNVSFWSDVVRKSPMKARGHNNLGLAYAGRGWTERAVKEYLEALRLKPEKNAYAHNNLGLAYAEQGRTEEAIGEYRESIRLKSGNVEVYNNLGLAYAGLKRPVEAIEEYKKALSIDPYHADVHYNLGLVYQEVGWTGEAEAAYERAIGLRADLVDAHNNLAIIYQSRGLVKRAMEKYRVVIGLRPDYHQARFNLGLAYAGQGRLPEAAEELRTAVRLYPGNESYRYTLGAIYARMGLRDEAAGEFREALQIRPDFPAAKRALGRVLGEPAP
ncbi:MAG: tetratricopeptide repeat protein [Thermodesulfobacteriota bacterium]